MTGLGAYWTTDVDIYPSEQGDRDLIANLDS
jgi:hypothetical protein